MKVVFLCGGIGKRMFPITEDKFLLKFLGKTLLEHQIERAKEAGLTDFVFIASPSNIDRVGEITKSLTGVKAELALQIRPMGIADALRSAERFFDGEIIVLNPNDIFERSAYSSLIEAVSDNSAISYLLGYEVKSYFPGGYLVVNENNELQIIIEKPGKGVEPSNLVNVMVHLHTDPKRLIKYADGVESRRDDIYECALDAMVRDKHKIKVVPYSGFWTAIKYPWHIFNVVRRFLDESEGYISPSANISDKAVIEGKVIISDNVRIFENAVIRGPVYIGPNSVIGNGSLVREYSHIGANCVVGYSTEVKNSYIGDNCWFHMSYIGDSIIAERCSFGAGTTLANFRFDEGNISVRIGDELVDTGLDKLGAIIGNNSRTGINASVLPGIRIGPNSVVGPHVCLAEDLEQGKFAVVEPRYRVMSNKIRVNNQENARGGGSFEK